MKNKKLLLILEKQVDKIVLAVFALISLVLLWVYVIGSPYSQKVTIQGRPKTLGPSEIDRYVKQEAEKMLPELEKLAPPINYNESYVSNYDQLLQCSISGISSSVLIPYPGAGDVIIPEERLYALPQIPALTNVAVADLRGAAKVPTEEITPVRTYANAMGTVEDIDLVSVSARFDVKKLFTNFQQSFMGPRLKTSWKDPALATPVFANLELQRRAMQKSGQWGPWETVPPAKIDSYQKQRKELPLTLEQSQFGVNLLVPLYTGYAVQQSILQPESYSFSVSRMEWLPPTFLKEALDLQDKEDEKLERQRREERLKARTPDTSRTATRPTPARRPPAGRDTRGRSERETVPDMMMGEGGYGITPRTVVPKERTVADVKKEFEKELLNEKSNIADSQDLLIWAHDDSVQPGNTYQYRMRVGVFNPIAGKDWFQKDQAEYKNQVVLWGDYSEPTEDVVVPRRVYVFPMEIIASKTAPNKTEGVKVEVDKYYLGQWRNFDFDVYQGQIIGYEVEDVQAANKTPYPVGMGGAELEMVGMMGDGQQPLVEKVDFTTGITFVDVAKETVWGSKLRQSVLYEMLYYDTDGLQEMPVGKSNWGSQTRETYAKIQKAMTRDVQRRDLGMPEGMPPDIMMDPMMMDPMMQQ